MKILATSSVLVLVILIAVSGGRSDEAPEVLLEGDEIVIDKGKTLNLTCRDRHPVTWTTSSSGSSININEVFDEGHEKPYVTSLIIDSVNFKHVGYYFCLPNTTDNRNRQSWDPDEPIVSPVYVYVKDEEHLLSIESATYIHSYPEINKNITFPCKPTFPDVEVNLDGLNATNLDPKRGFTFIPDKSEIDLVCKGSYKGQHVTRIAKITSKKRVLPKPTIMKVSGDNTSRNFMEEDKETYTVKRGTYVVINVTDSRKDGFKRIQWKVPDGVNGTGHHLLKRYQEDDGTIYRAYEIYNADKKRDSGEYIFYSENTSESKISESNSVVINVVDGDAVYVSQRAERPSIEKARGEPSISWVVIYHASSEPEFLWKKDDKVIAISSRPDEGDKKFSFTRMENDKCNLTIHNATVIDNGQYSLEAIVKSEDGKILGNDTITLNLAINASPYDVKINLNKDEPVYNENQWFQLVCNVTGYPKPDIELHVKQCFGRNNCTNYARLSDVEENPNNLTQVPSDSKEQGVEELRWNGQAKVPGFFKCKAHNIGGEKESKELEFLVTDGTELVNLTVKVKLKEELVDTVELEVYEDDNVTLSCLENKMRGSSAPKWTSDPEDAILHVSHKNSRLSYMSEVSPNLECGNKTQHSISFTCHRSDDPGLKVIRRIVVKPLVPPTWKGEWNRHIIEVKQMSNLSLSCEANGDPKPTVTWFKDNKIINSQEKMYIKVNGSHITFDPVVASHSGNYKCEVSNRASDDPLRRTVRLQVWNPDGESYISIIITVGLLTIVFISCGGFYCFRMYSDWQRTRILRLENHRMFVRGDPERINPELGLDQQAELLPYDTKFEIPREAIIFDKLLGSGAFGRVYKATVENVLPGQAQMTVAVKMSKSRSDTTQIKVLRSEVKIMIHIGRHVNIVNLLGACSKELATKGELLLVVEYCKHGNILDYMRRHKNGFVNQINEQDKIDPGFKAHMMRQQNDQGMRAKNSKGMKPLQLNFDKGDASYYAACTSSGGRTSSPEGATTDASSQSTFDSSHHFMVSDMTNQTYDNSSGDSDEYILPLPGEFSSNALCSKDLLCWAFQIARGMEYLAFRKVLHGDLAARNILLAEGNIVKISDFGLAKDIYKSDIYKKTSKGPMPVKWLALECFRDRVFSTQSDVWSYGIVLWEIFTLGQEPYAGRQFDEILLKKLENGMRLEQPKYSTHDIYRIMQECWESDPRSRPSFTTLEEKLGEMLGEAEKQQCLDLNEPYQADNEPSEYLSRIRSPDYFSIVRRSAPNLDGDGYEVSLCLSPSQKDFKGYENASMRQTKEIEKDGGAPSTPTASAQDNPNYILRNSAPLSDKQNMKERPHYVNCDEMKRETYAESSEPLESEHLNPVFVSVNSNSETKRRTVSETSSGLGSTSEGSTSE